MSGRGDVLGIGVDIVSVARVEKILARHPERFPRRILHPGERADYRERADYCGSPPFHARFLARRFAAKEAVVKALGLGFTGGAYARRIRIEHDALGRPQAALPPDLPAARRRCVALLSIADEKEYAVAQAIVVEEQP